MRRESERGLRGWVMCVRVGTRSNNVYHVQRERERESETEKAKALIKLRNYNGLPRGSKTLPLNVAPPPTRYRTHSYRREFVINYRLITFGWIVSRMLFDGGEGNAVCARTREYIRTRKHRSLVRSLGTQLNTRRRRNSLRHRTRARAVIITVLSARKMHADPFLLP